VHGNQVWHYLTHCPSIPTGHMAGRNTFAVAIAAGVLLLLASQQVSANCGVGQPCSYNCCSDCNADPTCFCPATGINPLSLQCVPGNGDPSSACQPHPPCTTGNTPGSNVCFTTKFNSQRVTDYIWLSAAFKPKFNSPGLTGVSFTSQTVTITAPGRGGCTTSCIRYGNAFAGPHSIKLYPALTLYLCPCCTPCCKRQAACVCYISSSPLIVPVIVPCNRFSAGGSVTFSPPDSYVELNPALSSCTTAQFVICEFEVNTLCPFPHGNILCQ
jgi:hypothetical protein